MFANQRVRSTVIATTFLIIAMVMTQLPAPPAQAAPAGAQLLVSTSHDRSNPVPLEGASLYGDVHIFVEVVDIASVTRVEFSIDRNSTTLSADTAAPYDYAGTAADGSAVALDASSLSLGQHLVEAHVRYRNGRSNMRATFTVISPLPGTYTRPGETDDSIEPPPADEVIDPPPVEESVESSPPASSNSRLGLHVTAEELDTWRQRAAAGPYRVQGDVSTNSPGDWGRVQQGAASFIADPSAGRWDGPVANNPGGCVVQASSTDGDLRYTPSHQRATTLRDAAFVALVQQNRDHAVAVRDELLAQAAISGVDFTNRNRYCLGTIAGDQKPIFNIANWQTRLLYAYDYVRIAYPDLFSTADTALLNRWFAGSAEWMQEAADSKLDQLFVNRADGDYRLTSTATGTWSRILYFNGEEARTLQRRYNNRVATAMRFVTLVGVDQANDSFIDSGRRFATEFIRFSYFPSGVFGEFERWADTRPTLGWKYATQTVGSIITIADVMARDGDPSVYTYTTTDGALGTEGAHHTGVPKSLATMVADLLRYVDHSYTRHGTATASRATD
ncbi:MAG TPA: Ig-like domain-containing protein, partial [Euzebya sp.]|nr:Ig-like domain-containing protein [Euzebya sp.]